LARIPEISSNSDWLILSCGVLSLTLSKALLWYYDTQMQVDKIIYLHILVLDFRKKVDKSFMLRLPRQTRKHTNRQRKGKN